MKKVLFSLVLLFSTATAQQLIPLGSFPKIEGPKREFFATGVEQLYDWENDQAIAIKNISDEEIAILTFNKGQSPANIIRFSIKGLEFKLLYPVYNYVKDSIHYIYVEYEKRYGFQDIKRDLELAVLMYNYRTNSCKIERLDEFIKQDTKQTIWVAFTQQQSFWVLSCDYASRKIGLHRFDGSTHVNVRTLSLSDNLWRHFIKEDFFTKKTRETDLRFAESRIDYLPKRTYALNMGVVGNEFVIVRARPIASTSSSFYIIKFGLNTEIVDTSKFTFYSNPLNERLICIYGDKLVLTQVLRDKLIVETRGIVKLNEVIQKREFPVSDTTVGKLLTYTSTNYLASDIFWMPERAKDKRNPFSSFYNRSGLAVMSLNSFTYTGDNGEMVLNLTRFSQSTAYNANFTSSYSMSFFNLVGLRLDPETLVLYSDPNGPFYEKRRAINEKIKELRKAEEVKILSRVTLRDGGELLLGQHSKDDSFHVYKATSN
jgi:hypothetical protein